MVEALLEKPSVCVLDAWTSNRFYWMMFEIACAHRMRDGNGLMKTLRMSLAEKIGPWIEEGGEVYLTTQPFGVLCLDHRHHHKPLNQRH